MKKSFNVKQLIATLILVVVLASLFAVPAYAADISGAVNGAFNSYVKPQIKSIVGVAVLGSIDAVLLVMFIIKIVTAGIEYHRRGGQFEWMAPAALFVGLALSCSASVWMWNAIGW